MDNRYKKITVNGLVQGIGFRPGVFLLADNLGISGTVQNTGGGAVILCGGAKDALEEFIENLNAPYVRIEDVKPFPLSGFEISESDNHDTGARFISPDVKICGKCASELFDGGRRNLHYFNSCVDCGPRFSIIKTLPYDRKNTAMDSFPLCFKCMEEYESAADRRFRAETICCKTCGPKLEYSGQSFADDLKNGGIVAVKGIGGYHFACSPYDRNAVSALRNIKGRDQKPFAVMFKNIDEIKKYCTVNAAEEALLLSNASPITLLEIKNNPFADEVLFGDFYCGCFLPYTPLHLILFEKFDALVMTSANSSGGPIIHDDEKMRRFFPSVLSHNRDILRPVEDSVVQAGQIIRRSRGYVPSPFPIGSDRCFLALGSDLKASFCLVKDGFAYPSQYFGDLENEDVFKSFNTGIEDFCGLFDAKPEFTVCDRHPGYFSHRNEAKQVYHHHAHIAGVMAEHGLDGEIIGVSFDGAGYGEDGNIWGGEFLIVNGEEFERAGHLEYVPIIGGDSMSSDALKTAGCYLEHFGLNIENVLLKAAVLNGINTVRCSSMGRLFDTLAVLLGLCKKNSYEGECAAALQNAAMRAKSFVPMEFKTDDLQNISAEAIIKAAFEKADDPYSFALGFHIAAADMVVWVCKRIREKTGLGRIALSGGVFQNALLSKMCFEKLSQSNFSVYFNERIPRNDGGLALGQAYIAAKGL